MRDVRGALGHIPPLPSKQEYDDVMRRLKAAQAALTLKLQTLREIEGWQRWANVGIQEQPCEKWRRLVRREPRRRTPTGFATCSSSGGRRPISACSEGWRLAAFEKGTRRSVVALGSALRG